MSYKPRSYKKIPKELVTAALVGRVFEKSKTNQEDLCYVYYAKEWKKAKFIGVFQFSNVIDPSPKEGGHPGGVVAYPIVVATLNGDLKHFSLSKVKFSLDDSE